MTKPSPRFPLRREQWILVVVAIVSLVIAVGLPFISAPGKTVNVETRTTTRLQPYMSTSTRYETRTGTTTQTWTYLTTSHYTETYTVTYYTTIFVYPTGFQYQGTGTGMIGTTVVIPVRVLQTQIQTMMVERTTRVTGTQTWTQTEQSAIQKVSTQVETTRSTQTLPYSSALFRSFTDNAVWLALGLLVPILAYHRINAYRTRLHIYYQILDYTAYSSRLSSHIMRACNLETRKFETYIEALTQKGFVNEIRQNGSKAYRASPKGLNIVRNQEIKRFVEELP